MTKVTSNHNHHDRYYTCIHQNSPRSEGLNLPRNYLHQIENIIFTYIFAGS